MQINRLPTRDTPAATDELAVYSSSHGDTRKISLAALVTWVKSAIETGRPCGWSYQETIQATSTVFLIPVPSPEHIHLHALVHPQTDTLVAQLPDPDVAFDGQNVLFTIEQHDYNGTATFDATTTGGGTVIPVSLPTFHGARGAQYEFRALTRTWFLVAR